MVTILLAALLGFLLQCWSRLKWQTGHDRLPLPPPGPTRWPAVGSIRPFLTSGGSMRAAFSHMSSKHGPIFSFKLFHYNCIGLASMDLIKEALNNPDVSHRPRLHAFEDFRHPDADGRVSGLIFGNGQDWKELRRFSLRSLRDLGMGKPETESFIQQEAGQLCSRIATLFGDEHEVVDLDVCGLLNVAVVNTLWRLITDKTLDPSDAKMVRLTVAFNRLVQISPISLWTMIPSSRWILPNLSGYQEAREAHEEVLAMAEEEINEFLQSHSNETSDCFISHFFRHFGQGSNQEQQQRLVRALKVTILDLFGAGSETTATTLSFAMLYLATNPKVQETLYRDVQGQGQAQGSYLKAFVAEVLRMSSIAYMGIVHSAKRDTRIRGYHVAKDSLVTFHLWDVHHDPKVWTDPHLFNPERFLTKSSCSLPLIIPFSVGQRSCPGKAMALQELYIFLTNLVRDFEFLPAPSHWMRSQVKEGLILTCKSSLRLKCRKRT